MLKAVSPQNRKLRPGQVWLCLIPLFNLVWYFFITDGISQSIEQEFKSRNTPIQNKPTFGLGIALSVMNCIYFVVSVFQLIINTIDTEDGDFIMMYGFIKFLLAASVLVLWIIYWVKVNEYKNKLLALQRTQSMNDEKISNNII